MARIETKLFARPTYYLAVLGVDGDFETNTAKDVKAAYANLASNGMHPDHGGDPELWKLITAAYNEAKGIFSKKRGKYESKTDQLWLMAFEALQKPATSPSEPEAAGTEEPKVDEPKAEEPKADKRAAGSKTTDGWVFEEKDGESKDDRRKRYARERQAYRYANDPDFAASRKKASRDSHQRTVKAKEAAKAAASE